MKILLVTLGVLLGLIVLAAAGAALVLDPFVKRVAESQSSKALGVPVEILDADASLYGRVLLEGFSAGNPEGFSEPRSLRFEALVAKARLGTVFDDVLEVDRLVVRAPELTLEFRDRRSNLSALMENLGRRDPEERQDPEGRAFRIRRLRVEGATLRVRADALGELKTLTLPAVELRDVGTSADAATMSEVVAAVLQTLLAEAMKATRDLLSEELRTALVEEMEAAARQFGGSFQNAAERARRTLRERVEDELERGLEKLREKLP